MKPSQKAPKSNKSYQLIAGIHAVFEALKNPKRRHQKLLISQKNFAHYQENIINAQKNAYFDVEIVDKSTIEKYISDSFIHQNILLITSPLPYTPLTEIIEKTASQKNVTLLILDQVCDPHNIGAVMRSAAAFNIQGIILLKTSIPSHFLTIAKSASGGLEHVPIISVTNIRQSMNILKKNGFWCIGFDENGKETLPKHKFDGKLALIFGAEGDGLRPLTKSECDLLVNIPTLGAIKSFNISVAVSLCLYEASKQQHYAEKV